jgi:hypothetical protein
LAERSAGAERRSGHRAPGAAGKKYRALDALHLRPRLRGHLSERTSLHARFGLAHWPETALLRLGARASRERPDTRDTRRRASKPLARGQLDGRERLALARRHDHYPRVPAWFEEQMAITSKLLVAEAFRHERSNSRKHSSVDRTLDLARPVALSDQSTLEVGLRYCRMADFRQAVATWAWSSHG